MGIETWKVFPKSLERTVQAGQPLPCSDQNPRLKCNETRWARDYCLAVGGSCEYKIEAHFDCLEQFYPKERVDTLRRNFKPSHLDYPTSEIYVKYMSYHFYHPMSGKQNFEGTL